MLFIMNTYKNIVFHNVIHNTYLFMLQDYYLLCNDYCNNIFCMLYKNNN